MLPSQPSPHVAHVVSARRRSQRGQRSASLIVSIAAMVTALGGTVGVLFQTGVIGHSVTAPTSSPPATGASPSPSGDSSPSPGPDGTASPSPSSTPTPTASPTPSPWPNPTATPDRGIHLP